MEWWCGDEFLLVGIFDRNGVFSKIEVMGLLVVLWLVEQIDRGTAVNSVDVHAGYWIVSPATGLLDPWIWRMSFVNCET